MAQDRLGKYKVKTKPIDLHLKSIYSRVRSQLVYECRDTVMNLYGLNHLSAETKAAKFLDRINKQFICLVASMIRHCLKAWSLGTFNQNSVEFKFETAFCLEDHSDQVQDLIVANVKAEVKDRLLRKTRPVDQEMVVYSVMELRERLFNHHLHRDQPTTTR
ncbi:hypothetical protein BDZ91DRAFT_754517 [Kalaharituber pfeilii]|nr:hypothetical protein BDZ91DRAFT_754517 [Kalaharituber pfeilii]